MSISKLIFVLSLIYLSSSINLKSESKQLSADDCDIIPPVIATFTPPVTPIYSFFRTGELTGAREPIVALSNPDFIKKALNSPQPNAAYCTKKDISFTGQFNNQSVCQTSVTNNFFVIIFKFCLKKGDQINVKTYNDFGTGGLLTIDGKLISRRKDDIWWAGDGNNVSFIGSYTADSDKVVKVELIGGEICCGGGHVIQAKINNQAYENYSVEKSKSYCDSIGVKMNDDISPTIVQ